MERFAVRRGSFQCRPEDGVAEKVPVFYRQRYPAVVLVYFATRSQMHVADFGITHLIVRKSHVLSGTAYQRMGIIALEPIPRRLVRAVDGIILGVVAMAPAIEYD